MTSSDTNILFFGGKGGVGKTTCSAAVAVKLASEGISTLHITSDPAPSLSDIYCREIGGTLTSITPGLDAMEITQEKIAGVWKEKFGPDFLYILSHILDVEGMLEEGKLDLLDYIGTAPSLREETLLDMIRELADEGNYRRIIWDTAPAGETLKLLGMPKLMRQHLRAGTRVYEALDRLTGAVSRRKTLGNIMEEWVQRSDELSRFLKEKTLFFIVANPEALVVSQAERILTFLRESGLDLGGLIINRIAGMDGFGFPEGMVQRHKEYTRELVRLSGGMPVAKVPMNMEEIRGIGPLRELGGVLLKELRLKLRPETGDLSVPGRDIS